MADHQDLKNKSVNAENVMPHVEEDLATLRTTFGGGYVDIYCFLSSSPHDAPRQLRTSKDESKSGAMIK